MAGFFINENGKMVITTTGKICTENCCECNLDTHHCCPYGCLCLYVGETCRQGGSCLANDCTGPCNPAEIWDQDCCACVICDVVADYHLVTDLTCLLNYGTCIPNCNTPDYCIPGTIWSTMCCQCMPCPFDLPTGDYWTDSFCNHAPIPPQPSPDPGCEYYYWNGSIWVCHPRPPIYPCSNTCPSGFRRDETAPGPICPCIDCAPITCTSPFIFETNTCNCVCPPHADCTPDEFYDEATCACEPCTSPDTCEAPKIWKIGCICECDHVDTCDALHYWDAELCNCELKGCSGDYFVCPSGCRSCLPGTCIHLCTAGSLKCNTGFEEDLLCCECVACTNTCTAPSYWTNPGRTCDCTTPPLEIGESAIVTKGTRSQTSVPYIPTKQLPPLNQFNLIEIKVPLTDKRKELILNTCSNCPAFNKEKSICQVAETNIYTLKECPTEQWT